ncbi:MAG: hypothetical protein ACI93P_002310 [bacterium]|jgi:hypothetical protein
MKDSRSRISIFIENLFESKRNQYLFFTLISCLIFLYSHSIGMFWDNVLFSSQIGNHLYNNDLFNWLLPDILDAGHPPALGFMLAILWKVIGHKLWVSHLLMIPFTIGLLYQLFQFVNYFTKSYLHSLFAFLLIIIDPTLATQFLLVNPEIIQVFLFFLAINSILYKRYKLKVIALFFLSIISLRSMMLCGGVFIFEIINSAYINKTKGTILNKKLILSYVIGSLPALSYLGIHYISKGWLVTHSNSPWSNNHQFISLEGFIKNCIVLIHRYADFGRFIIYILIVFCFIKFRKIIFDKKTKQLLVLSFSSVIIVIIISLLSTNSFGHRYFITSFISLNLLSYILLLKFFRKKIMTYGIVFIILFSGNFWIYPKEIAQGWDATLAHLPYHKLRIDAISYLDSNKINIEKVGTFFPNSTTLDNISLNGDLRSFEVYTGKNEYVLFSNVFNLNEDEYVELDNNYSIIQQFNSKGIYILIYKLKK